MTTTHRSLFRDTPPKETVRVQERDGFWTELLWQDAIDENERAVQIVPTFIRALIELGRLYQKTDQRADAVTRLEQAIAAGAEYADVHYLLGNLYRDQGEVKRAQRAYQQALALNDHYEAASQALSALTA